MPSRSSPATSSRRAHGGGDRFGRVRASGCALQWSASVSAWNVATCQAAGEFPRLAGVADRWAELTAEDTYLDGLRAWWTACWPADRRARAGPVAAGTLSEP